MIQLKECGSVSQYYIEYVDENGNTRREEFDDYGVYTERLSDLKDLSYEAYRKRDQWERLRELKEKMSNAKDLTQVSLKDPEGIFAKNLEKLFYLTVYDDYKHFNFCVEFEGWDNDYVVDYPTLFKMMLEYIEYSYGDKIDSHDLMKELTTLQNKHETPCISDIP